MWDINKVNEEGQQDACVHSVDFAASKNEC